VTDRFEATTTVRRPRILLMWALTAVMAARMGAMVVGRVHFSGLPWWAFAPEARELAAALDEAEEVSSAT
jgi:hypothetical protein